MAVVGSDDFDAMQIDVSSVVLSRADGVGGEVAPNEGPPGPHTVIDDVATPYDGQACDCHDAEGDGIDDLALKFRTDDVVEILELADLNPGDELELVVTGLLLDGTEFTTAGDYILIVPQGTSNLLVRANVPGAFVEVSRPGGTGDESGFANFQRTYTPGTVVTLTAPAEAEGLAFYAWRIDDVMQPAGQTTIGVVMIEGSTAEAVYTPGAFTRPSSARRAGSFQRRARPGM